MANKATYITVGIHLPEPADSNLTRYRQFPVPHRAIGFLISGHLSHLWSAYPTPDLEDIEFDPEEHERNFEGCCPRCCGLCWALKQLVDADTLELLLGDVDKNTFYWDDKRQEVSRAWLQDAWKLTACHDQLTPEELAELDNA